MKKSSLSPFFRGKVWRFGEDVDTDAIIPARYLNTTDPRELARHCMADADPAFAREVKPGAIIVAGKNFGCGSSREHAPLAIKAAGVSCVIAAGFARIFYRNAFNIGLPILESPEAAEVCRQGDELEVDLATGKIRNLTRKRTFTAQPIPAFMQALISDGGLIKHIAKRLKEGP
ncbi:MAG: 3-isopropylmalate dehydratase small subunit [Deltaproteobacteria bacterium]|nr:3-isopropylmalate dehydratase small subunit [Deltaproteobacteria bacterium]